MNCSNCKEWIQIDMKQCEIGVAYPTCECCGAENEIVISESK